jgi:membrane-bound metal-dependent hydrolase YbcI (DUF457 family)
VNTPSHLIINAAIRKRAQGAGHAIPRGPFLLGAVLPDIPLTLLWIGAYIWYRHIQGNPAVSLMDESFDRLYFTHPLWITSYNTLHAPVLLLTALALLWRSRGREGSRRQWWFWFFAGCLVHSALDIPVHVTDGPLLFFPLEWSIRFHSPVSYWDPRHYGRQFALFELLLNLALLAYLFGPATVRWLAKRRAAQVET